MTFIKSLLNRLHPVLRPLSSWYLSKTRTFVYQGIKIKVMPGVFHPGLFFSTKVLLTYLQTRNISNKRILELGAGTGLISIYCHRNGAYVLASDISKTALQNIRENAATNHAQVSVIESNLFDEVDPTDFDIIIINPPYYPIPVTLEKDMPWFCGENFEYFENFFYQLKGRSAGLEILMILSQDCDLKRIKLIAQKNLLRLTEIYSTRKLGEQNTIYLISE